MDSLVFGMRISLVAILAFAGLGKLWRPIPAGLQVRALLMYLIEVKLRKRSGHFHGIGAASLGRALGLLECGLALSLLALPTQLSTAPVVAIALGLVFVCVAEYSRRHGKPCGCTGSGVATLRATARAVLVLVLAASVSLGGPGRLGNSIVVALGLLPMVLFLWLSLASRPRPRTVRHIGPGMSRRRALGAIAAVVGATVWAPNAAWAAVPARMRRSVLPPFEVTDLLLLLRASEVGKRLAARLSALGYQTWEGSARATTTEIRGEVWRVLALDLGRRCMTRKTLRTSTLALSGYSSQLTRHGL